jgi:hypothetical protein
MTDEAKVSELLWLLGSAMSIALAPNGQDLIIKLGRLAIQSPEQFEALALDILARLEARRGSPPEAPKPEPGSQ